MFICNDGQKTLPHSMISKTIMLTDIHTDQSGLEVEQPQRIWPNRGSNPKPSDSHAWVPFNVRTN